MIYKNCSLLGIRAVFFNFVKILKYLKSILNKRIFNSKFYINLFILNKNILKVI